MISKEIKELVNSARLTAQNEERRFTWVQVKHEILNSLVDVTHIARLLSLTQLERGQSSARLWISQLTSKRALLEDKELKSPILLPPEIIYLELALGRFSPLEGNTFAIPTLGDDLFGLDRRGRHIWTLAALKTKVDACTQPPPFRDTKSPINDLINRPKLKTPDASVARATGQPCDKKANGNNEQRKKNDTRPSHERPSSFPATLKRPDPKMTVNGKSISSEQQRPLYDDIKNDRCTRCHQKGHLRRNCPDTTPQKWEQRFKAKLGVYCQMARQGYHGSGKIEEH